MTVRVTVRVTVSDSGVTATETERLRLKEETGGHSTGFASESPQALTASFTEARDD